MPLQVLVVEDDDRIRTVLRLALEDEGYRVAEAADTPTALELARAELPDLMMVDLMLGEVDGCRCYIDKRLDAAWGKSSFVLDVEPGEPEGLSLSAGEHLRFVTRAAATEAG